jgi:nitrogen-specific signal transduction histidine kinase
MRQGEREKKMSDATLRESATGAEEWLSLSDELLAGLVHGLNNRVTAMRVCAELLTFGDDQMASGGVLAAEVDRLQRVSALIALLPARNPVAEALEIAPVLDDAIALHAQHPRMRAIECVVERSGELQPLRVPRWALLRLLLFVVHAAKGAAGDERREHVTLYLAGDADSVTVRALTRGDGGVYAAAMASCCGGVLTREAEKLALTLPSLGEVRRRELLARTAD